MKNQLITISDSTAYADSRVIAEGFGIEHKNLKETITKHFDQARLKRSFIESGNNEGRVSHYYLTKEEVMLLPAICKPSEKLIDFQRLIISEFQKMEKMLASKAKPAVNTRVSPSKRLGEHLGAASILGVPLHIAQVEAVKRVETETGTDFAYLLPHSQASQNIPAEETMFTPTEIGRKIGSLSAKAVNEKLALWGWQVSVGEGKAKEWVATGLGLKYSAICQWTVKSKSGYHLKWNWIAFRSAFYNHGIVPSSSQSD